MALTSTKKEIDLPALSVALSCLDTDGGLAILHLRASLALSDQGMGSFPLTGWRRPHVISSSAKCVHCHGTLHEWLLVHYLDFLQGASSVYTTLHRHISVPGWPPKRDCGRIQLLLSGGTCPVFSSTHSVFVHFR